MSRVHKIPVTMTADFYGPVPSGEKLLVITDLYSKFPIVEILRSTAFPTVSDHLDSVFSILGYPIEMKTDNDPPWDGKEIETFLKNRNIKYNPSIPLGQEATAKWKDSFRTSPKQPVMQQIRQPYRGESHQDPCY